jgi:hypothetical protein
VATPPPFSRRGSSLVGGLAVAVVTAVLMIATEPRLAIVWDEGYTLGRVARIRDWFQALRDPAQFAASWPAKVPLEQLVQREDREVRPSASDIDRRAKLFRRPMLDYFWPFAREEPHGHPPFYAILGLVGDVLTPFRSDLARARLGPMLFFSFVAGCIYAFFSRRWGPWPAALASGAWVLQPRLFGHGHYALYDGVLTCLWVSSILTFAKAVEGSTASRPRIGWSMAFGVLVGCALATKLTGWFLPVPFMVWAAIRFDRRAAWALAIGGLVAIGTLYAICPPFWGQPIGGLERFCLSNLSRANTTKIPALFLGHVYMTPKESLPWYNTLVWTLFITPAGFLVLAFAGVLRSIRLAKSEPFGLLAVGHWAFLLLLRSLPNVPGHDAERQFLASFGCLALVAGIGAVEVMSWRLRWGRALAALAVIEGVVSVALMMPVPLSYYSPVVGGLPGAVKLGMEPTYYWDGLTDEALDWLNANTPPGEQLSFSSFPTSWFYLHQTGRLKPRLYVPWDRGQIAWYVVQNRTGLLGPRDRDLVARMGPRHVVVQKWGVPLVWAFPGSELSTDAMNWLDQHAEPARGAAGSPLTSPPRRRATP